jgi:uncharacterized protein (TIGR02646 family)
MIRLERGPPPPEARFVLGRANDKIQAFFALSVRERHQRPFIDFIGEMNSVRTHLRKVTHGKCAYCETPLDEGPSGALEHYRPKIGASEISGRGSVDHYGWLAAEWDNLLIVCAACNQSKRNLFPVTRTRAPIGTDIEVIDKIEEPLLLDPFKDDPDLYLIFLPNGYVEPIGQRGEVTIRVLGLNREALVSHRRTLCETLLATRQAALTAPQLWQALDAAIKDDAPFSATARALLARPGPAPAAPVMRSYAPVAAPPARPDIVESEADADAFRLGARPIQSLEVRNFKLLRDFRVDLPQSTTGTAPWLMLLGENATGKTTVMQAIALALAGADEANRWTKPASVLTLGQDEGSIILRFWDHPRPVELRFSRDVQAFAGTPRPSAMVLGYGALRYPQTRNRLDPPGASPFARIGPIMQAFASIPNPRAWMSKLPDEPFDAVARVLKSVLPIQDDSIMVRRRGKILFQIGKDSVSLEELSSGYQAIVALTADVIRMLFERWEMLEGATAIVLVDELDAHLHPRWKMRIVRSLREALPATQFITSTHDPLVLRGLHNGEAVVMRRDDRHGAFADADLPSIEGMEVDEILRSRHFGLSSTLDPEVEALFNEYYHLQSLPQTSERRARTEELRQQLAGKGEFGRNRREQLMFEAADLFIAEEDRAASDGTRRQLKTETLARLQRLWSERTGAPKT